MIRLDVYLEELPEPVGTLEAADDVTPVFRYASQHLTKPQALPLSLSLPVRAEPFTETATRAFFANLLPEGEALEAVARRHRLDSNDLVGLLAQVGAECAGAVSIVREGTTPPKRPGVIPEDYVAQTPAELQEEIEALSRGQEPAPRELLRLSLAGVQRKMALLVGGDGVTYRPRTVGAPTTHIIKVSDHTHDDLVLNETFCMEVCRQLGLPTAKADAKQIARLPYIQVLRYDRRRLDRPGGETIYRLHQEDFLQAMGLHPTRLKYSEHGGPSAAACFALAEATSRPAQFRRKLLQALIMAFLVGNGDAHAKNFSLLYSDGQIDLAPLYDMVCTKIYDLAPSLALSIGERTEFDAIDREAWSRFSKQAGFAKKYVEAQIEKLARAVLPAARAAQETLDLPGRITDRILQAIGDQVRLVNKGFGLEIPVDTAPFVRTVATGWPGMS